MHLWGEEGFDWEGLGDAIIKMDVYMRRWGRIGVYSKEKYGTARLYITWYYHGLFSLIYPGYIHYGPWENNPFIGRYLMWLEFNIFQPLSQMLRLHILIHWWQNKIYNLAYQRAIKRYPHLIEEILCCADYPELIKNYGKYIKCENS